MKHSRRDKGTLTFGREGISYSGRKNWRWEYQDIQRLTMSPRSLTVLTYRDNKWKLGKDRSYDFQLTGSGSFENAFQFLKGRLDQRFAGYLADRLPDALWEIPVKHLARIVGSEGTLRVTADEIVYSTEKPGDSRTWRYKDIDNISSSGPFQLTVTAFDHKTYDFQLKDALDPGRYDDLWLRLNRSKGLQLLDSYRTNSATAPPAGASNAAAGNRNPLIPRDGGLDAPVH